MNFRRPLASFAALLLSVALPGVVRGAPPATATGGLALEGTVRPASADFLLSLYQAGLQARARAGERERLLAAAAATLRSAVARTFDDAVVLEWARLHLAHLLDHPEVARAAASGAEMMSPFERGDHDGLKSSRLRAIPVPAFLKDAFPQPTQLGIVFRDALAEIVLAELRARGHARGYDALAALTPSARAQIRDAAARRLGALANEVALRGGYPREMQMAALSFADRCDATISRVLASGERTASAGAGYDRVSDPSRRTIGEYGPRTGDGAEKFPYPRFHVLASLHIYSDRQGVDLKSPVFVPASCFGNAGIPGRGRYCIAKDEVDGSCVGYNETYSPSCKTLGRYREVQIVMSHVSRAGQAIDFSRVNAAGSRIVGYLGGEGGQDEDGYRHSHLQLYGYGKRLNFADALCRSDSN